MIPSRNRRKKKRNTRKTHRPGEKYLQIIYPIREFYMEYINSLYNIQEVNLKNNVIENWHYSEEDMQMPICI